MQQGQPNQGGMQQQGRPQQGMPQQGMPQRRPQQGGQNQNQGGPQNFLDFNRVS